MYVTLVWEKSAISVPEAINIMQSDLSHELDFLEMGTAD